MRILKVHFLLLIALISVEIKAQTITSLPQKVFECIKQQQFDQLFQLVDTTGLTKEFLAAQRIQMETNLTQFGKAKKLIATLEDDAGVKKHYALCIQFKKEKKNLYLIVNAQQKIEKYTIKEFNDSPFFQLKGYNGFAEVTDLTTAVKTRDGLTLGANIAFGDTSKQKSPLVIFVHGSGVSDRDETIGPNKPFRDLAQGFAQKGIVSLRYDKRGYDRHQLTKQMMDSIDIYTETIYDAIDAINVAKQFSFIDTNQIYIVGHSQGAMCAPMIAKLSPKIKGIIMLAGPAKNLIDVLPEQARYMALLDDTITNLEEMQLTQNKWLVDKLKNPAELKKMPKALLGGTGYKYWQSIIHFNQVETAQSLSIPIYILNGENDFQVIMSEFELWKTQLPNKPNVQFKSYPKLNHLFLETIGERGMKEYDIPGHIPQYVIDDLVKFIK
jgi:dienelactone hydrolase